MSDSARTDPRHMSPFFEAPDDLTIVEIVSSQRPEIHGRWPSEVPGHNRITIEIAPGMAVHGHPGVLAQVFADAMIEARKEERRLDSASLYLMEDNTFSYAPAAPPEPVTDPFDRPLPTDTLPLSDIEAWHSRTEGGASGVDL